MRHHLTPSWVPFVENLEILLRPLAWLFLCGVFVSLEEYRISGSSGVDFWDVFPYPVPCLVSTADTWSYVSLDAVVQFLRFSS